MPRNTLIAIVIAVCPAAVQAQFESGFSTGATAATSSISAPEPSASTSTGSAGSGLDLQAATQARCDRLKNENIMNYGGLMSEDMQAKTQYCKWAESIPAPR